GIGWTEPATPLCRSRQWHDTVSSPEGRRKNVRRSGTGEVMTAAMFIAQCLKQEGVTKVFGQCGHTNYALIDSCHRLGIDYVSFRHEQLATHAADAYYRV